MLDFFFNNYQLYALFFLKKKDCSDIMLLPLCVGFCVKSLFCDVLLSVLLSLIQNTIGKVTNSQIYTTNESQEVSPFPAGDHKAQISRRAQKHNKHKTEEI